MDGLLWSLFFGGRTDCLSPSSQSVRERDLEEDPNLRYQGECLFHVHSLVSEVSMRNVCKESINRPAVEVIG